MMLYYMLTSKVCDRSSEFIVTLVSAGDTLVINSFQKFDGRFASNTKLVRYKIRQRRSQDIFLFFRLFFSLLHH